MLGSLKGQCREIFCFWFPQASDYTIWAVSNFSKIRGDIGSSRFATGVNDTGGKWKKNSSRKILIIWFGHLWVVELTYKFLLSSSLYGICSLILLPLFATGVVDTGGKIAAGIVDTGGKFAAGINNACENGRKFATGVADTGGKFATGVVDTGSNFAAGVVDTGGKFATGVVDTCSARDWDGKDYLRIIPRVVW